MSNDVASNEATHSLSNCVVLRGERSVTLKFSARLFDQTVPWFFEPRLDFEFVKVERKEETRAVERPLPRLVPRVREAFRALATKPGSRAGGAAN